MIIIFFLLLEDPVFSEHNIAPKGLENICLLVDFVQLGRFRESDISDAGEATVESQTCKMHRIRIHSNLQNA